MCCRCTMDTVLLRNYRFRCYMAHRGILSFWQSIFVENLALLWIHDSTRLWGSIVSRPQHCDCGPTDKKLTTVKIMNVRNSLNSCFTNSPHQIYHNTITSWSISSQLFPSRLARIAVGRMYPSKPLLLCLRCKELVQRELPIIDIDTRQILPDLRWAKILSQT